MIAEAIENEILGACALQRIPVRLEMEVGCYINFMSQLGERWPSPMHVGMDVPELYQMPVKIVAGPTNEFRVITG